jgi:hypothetical protein
MFYLPLFIKISLQHMFFTICPCYVAIYIVKKHICYCFIQYICTCTVKPTHAVTSIKQSPVLKCHLFLVMPWKISYELKLFTNVLSTLIYKDKSAAYVFHYMSHVCHTLFIGKYLAKGTDN